jgi:hypothetical protein
VICVPDVSPPITNSDVIRIVIIPRFSSMVRSITPRVWLGSVTCSPAVGKRIPHVATSCIMSNDWLYRDEDHDDGTCRGNTRYHFLQQHHHDDSGAWRVTDGGPMN